MTMIVWSTLGQNALPIQNPGYGPDTIHNSFGNLILNVLLQLYLKIIKKTDFLSLHKPW